MIKIDQLQPNKLKQFIAIAAQQAGFDTQDKDQSSDYRMLLYYHTGQYSAADMSKQQLLKVLQHFVDKGFVVKGKNNQTENPAWLKKLLSIWLKMGEQGFVRNANFATLEAWAKSNYLMGQRPPQKLDWMGKASRHLIEKLKRYHMREIEAATANILAKQRGKSTPTITQALEVLGNPHAKYELVINAYSELVGALAPGVSEHGQH